MWTFLPQCDQRVQGSVFSQPGNDCHTSYEGRFEETSFSVAAIGDCPTTLSDVITAVRSISNWFRSLLTFVMKPNFLLVDVFGADMHLGQERHANSQPNAFAIPEPKVLLRRDRR